MGVAPIPFVGGHYQGRSPDACDQRTINLYPETNSEGGRENPVILLPTPGLKVWKDFGYMGEVRGMKVLNSALYAVVRDKVYMIGLNKTETLISGTLATSTGIVFMESNANGQVMIVDRDGACGYCVDSGTVSVITDLVMMNPTSLAYQDGYGIITERNSGRFWISGLNDFTVWSALDYSNAETLPDNVLSCISDHRELWMFGEQTAEIYTNTGNSDFPFERINGVSLELGIGAPASLAKLDSSIFFLDQWGNVRRVDGYTPTIISTPQVAYQINQYDDISDAIGMAYVHAGHSFYTITFPSSDSTWCYDVATGYWHKRSSYPKAPESRWRANNLAFFAGKNLAGDFENGKIYELDHERYDDDGHILPAVRRGQAITSNRNAMFLNEFEINIQSGVGLPTGQGDDPTIMLKCSKDGGHTWGNEKWASMGKAGEYTHRVRWHRLGRARTWTPEITITDPVNRVILGAYADFEV